MTSTLTDEMVEEVRSKVSEAYEICAEAREAGGLMARLHVVARRSVDCHRELGRCLDLMSQALGDVRGTVGEIMCWCN